MVAYVQLTTRVAGFLLSTIMLVKRWLLVEVHSHMHMMLFMAKLLHVSPVFSVGKLLGTGKIQIETDSQKLVQTVTSKSHVISVNEHLLREIKLFARLIFSTFLSSFTLGHVIKLRTL
jgi:hypothetical protein